MIQHPGIVCHAVMFLPQAVIYSKHTHSRPVAILAQASQLLSNPFAQSATSVCNMSRSRSRSRKQRESSRCWLIEEGWTSARIQNTSNDRASVTRANVTPPMIVEPSSSSGTRAPVNPVTHPLIVQPSSSSRVLPVPPIQPPPMRVVAAFRKAAKDALKEQIKQTEDDLAILKQRLLEMPD
jgi:hypothetical protein